jgi:hypothetical protein
MPEEDFEIIHDEYRENVQAFIEKVAHARFKPSAFQSEMYGSWFAKEEDIKRVPVCADSFSERCAITQRLLNAWMTRPELSLGKLVSMPFSSMSALFQAGDYDLIRAIETIRSLDHPRCEGQIEKDLAILRELKEAKETLSRAISLFGGEE